MSESNRPVMVEISHDTRQKLREVAQDLFDEDTKEVSYDELINRVLTQLLEEKQAEEEARQQKQEEVRVAILGEDGSTSDDDATLSEAEKKQQEIREGFGH